MLDTSLFENAFQYASIGMALVSPDGRWLRVNRSLCQLVGYTEEELMRLTFQDLTHPEDLESDLVQVEKMLKGEIETYQMEKRYFHKSGQTVWALLSVSLVRELDNKPRFFISQIKDITARKLAEHDLDVFFNLPMIFRAILGSDGHFKRVSPQWMDALGYSREELLARHTREFVHPDDWERTEQAMREDLAGGSRKFFQNRLRRADGTYLWLMWSGTGVPERGLLFAAATDITLLKEAEARAMADASEKEQLYDELRQATEEVRTLQQELLTVCAWTKQVRSGDAWESIEAFLSRRLRLKISHGISEGVAQGLISDLHKQIGDL